MLGRPKYHNRHPRLLRSDPARQTMTAQAAQYEGVLVKTDYIHTGTATRKDFYARIPHSRIYTE